MGLHVWLEGGHWGLLTAVYLFFAGLGGGAYLAGLLAQGLARREQREQALAFARRAYLVALVAAGISGLSILAHLADPLAGLLFPLTLTEFGSWITRGTWILVSLGLIAALQTLWLHFGSLGKEASDENTALRWVAARVGLNAPLDRLADVIHPGSRFYWIVASLGLLPALGTIYTGFELAVVETVPLWNNPTLLPGLFIASGIAAGMATALALSIAFDGLTGRLLVGFAGAVELGLVLSGLLLWALWNSLGTSEAATASTTALTSGSMALPFQLLVASLVLSLIITPLLVWLRYARTEASITNRLVRPGLVTSLMLGVGSVFLIRYVLVFAAVKNPVVVI